MNMQTYKNRYVVGDYIRHHQNEKEWNASGNCPYSFFAHKS
jgi:hypothetical protein